MIEIKAKMTKDGTEITSAINGTGTEVLHEASGLIKALLAEVWKADENIGAAVMYETITTMKKITGYNEEASVEPTLKAKYFGKELN